MKEKRINKFGKNSIVLAKQCAHLLNAFTFNMHYFEVAYSDVL